MGFDLRLLRQALSAKAALLATILLGLAAAIAIILQARVVSRIVAQVFLGGQTLDQVLPLMLGLLGIIAARAVFSFLADGAAGEVAIRVKLQLRELLLQKLVRLGPAHLQAHPGGTGELSAVVIQGIEALDAYFSQFIPQLALAALIPLSILSMVFPLDLLTGVVLLITAPLIPVFMILVGSASQAVTRKQWGALSRMSAFFLDTLQGLTTLKLLGRSREHAAKIARVSENYRAATMSVLRVTFLSALVLELVGTLSTAVIAVEIGLRLLHFRIEFEQAFFILMIAPEFYWPLRQLGLRFHAGMSGVAAANRIFAVLDEAEPEIPPPGVSPLAQNGQPHTGNLRDLPEFVLTFDGVSFTYPGRSEIALENIHITLRSGQQVALVGPSGAGKTTLVQLLLRFIEPQSGQILLNGQPLNVIALDEWRRNIAWVPQMPHIFQGTIAENIRLGKPGADLAEVREAARKARLDDWIVSLPEGYDTPVGEQGSRLSGGQAQRLALARAFLADAPLLLLDEPTAHLDPREEALLEEGLRDLRVGRTVMVVAHRLPTVVRSDQIILLEGGRVAACGSHAELFARGGLYARLVQAYGGEA